MQQESVFKLNTEQENINLNLTKEVVINDQKIIFDSVIKSREESNLPKRLLMIPMMIFLIISNCISIASVLYLSAEFSTLYIGIGIFNSILLFLLIVLIYINKNSMFIYMAIYLELICLIVQICLIILSIFKFYNNWNDTNTIVFLVDSIIKVIAFILTLMYLIKATRISYNLKKKSNRGIRISKA